MDDATIFAGVRLGLVALILLVGVLGLALCLLAVRLWKETRK